MRWTFWGISGYCIIMGGVMLISQPEFYEIIQTIYFIGFLVSFGIAEILSRLK